MLVYLIILFIVITAVYVAYKARRLPGASKVLLGIAFVVMVLAAGLRDQSVGTDTAQYVEYFDQAQSFEQVLDLSVASESMDSGS